jgi:hypothetical protein
MHIVDFEFDGETYTLPRLGDLPVECFKDGRITHLIETAPDGFLDFMWDMSRDEAKAFVRAWATASRPPKKPEPRRVRWGARVVLFGPIVCMVALTVTCVLAMFGVIG